MAARECAWFVAAAMIAATASGTARSSARSSAALLQVADVRAEVTDVVAASVPTGTAAQLARALVERDESLWIVLGESFAERLAAMLDPEAAATLEAAIEEDPAAAWATNRETLAPVVRAALEAESFALSRFGCAIGLLARPAAAALERARAAGKNPELTVLVELLAPVLPSVSATCECVLRTLPAEAVTSGIHGPAGQEIAAALRAAIESGVCADPFAGLSAGP